MQTLYTGKDIEVRFDDHGGDTCFVTFTSLDNHRDGFAQNLLSRRGVSTLYFISRWNHWWLSPEMAPQIEEIRSMLTKRGFHKRVGYGASMGGFGTALHAKALNLDTAVLIAPQYSIDAQKVPFEARWRPEATKLDFSFDKIETALSPQVRYVVILDEASADRPHADLYAAHVPIERINIIGGGHTPGIMLRETGQLSDFFFDIVENRFSYATMRQTFRNKRRRSAVYYAELSLRVLPRRRDLARKLHNQAIALAPNNPVYALRGANMALDAGELERCETLALQTIELVPKHPAPWRTLSKLATARGQFDAAVEAAKNAVSRRPKDADLQRVLMEALLAAEQ